MRDGRASDKVLEKIQEKIFSGEWKPGEKIMSENQLAKELSVSRVSVRAAMEKLVTLNIINKKQGGGTFVNNLNPSIYMNSLIPMLILDRDNYIDILEFRLVMEPETTKLCTERCSDDLIKELELCYEDMVKYKDDIKRFTEEDLKFHTKISEGTSNSLIIKVNELLINILEYHQEVLYKNLGPKGGINEHKLILEAIKNRDAELAAIYSRRHVQRTINDVKK